MIGSALFRSALLACSAAFAFLPAFSQSVTLTPTSVSFGNQAQGTSSAVRKVTLKNGQSSAITVSSVTTNLPDYSETNNCPVSPATLAARGTCTISLTFTPSAQGLRTGTLTVVDTGLSSPQSASLTGTGTAPALVSMAVTPGTASVTVRGTQQFAATGTYSDGSTQNLTTSASWTSSNTSIATVQLHTGLATGLLQGTATITATSGKIAGSAALAVTGSVLSSIAVTPKIASVAAGKTQQFSATGTYSNGTKQNLTSTAIWSSSANAVATVSSGGLATSVAKGSASITATSGTISGAATLTVTAPLLISITVSPGNPSIAKGTTQQFAATGTYSDNSTQDLTSSVSWSSSSTSVATIVAGGLATGASAGTATITAASGSITASATLTVSPAALVSLAVTPANASLALGTTLPLMATGTYSDGSTQNLTATATWSSANPAVASVNSQGVSSGVAAGSTAVTAASATISGSTILTVTPPALASIAVTPASPTLSLGMTQQFTATGTYTDGSKQNITATVQWSSDTPTVATISNNAATAGLATSVARGTATITSASGSVTGSATLTVTGDSTCLDNTQTIPPPATAPFSGLAGMGTVVNDPEPGSGFPCFHNPLIRISDANFYQGWQSTVSATKANASIFGDTSGSGFTNLWSTDSSSFIVGDSGKTWYVLGFNPATRAVTKECTSYNNAMGWYLMPSYSRTTANRVYTLQNTSDTAAGTVLVNYESVTSCPNSPTGTVYDFSSSSNGLAPGTWFVTDPVFVNNTDTAFAAGFSASASQNTARNVCAYTVASGVTCLNLTAGAPTITGDWGTTGTPVLQNPAGTSSSLGTFTVHNVKCSLDCKYVVMAQGIDDGSTITSCTAAAGTNGVSCSVASTAIFQTGMFVAYSGTSNGAFNSDHGFTITSMNAVTNTITGTEMSTLTGAATGGNLYFNLGPDPIVWEVGTTNVWQECTIGSGLCTGHWTAGYTQFLNDQDQLLKVAKVINNPATAVAIPSSDYSSACGKVAGQFDYHPGSFNLDAAEQNPVFYTTTSVAGPPSYTYCDVNEVDAMFLPTNTLLSGQIERFAHTYGLPNADFNVGNSIGSVSQDGNWYYFTSPMNNQLGDTSGNFPCAGTCRGDIFVVSLAAD